MKQRVWCRARDSNPHCAGLKPAASSNWASAAVDREQWCTVPASDRHPVGSRGVEPRVSWSQARSGHRAGHSRLPSTVEFSSVDGPATKNRPVPGAGLGGGGELSRYPRHHPRLLHGRTVGSAAASTGNGRGCGAVQVLTVDSSVTWWCPQLYDRAASTHNTFPGLSTRDTQVSPGLTMPVS